MNRALGAALALLLPLPPAFSAEISAPIEPLAGLQPASIAAPAASVQVQPALPALGGLAAALPPDRVEMSRASGPEPAQNRGTLSRFFDGLRQAPQNFGGFLNDLFRGENREASVNASAFVLAVRDQHGLRSQSRGRTAAATVMLRRFRLDLGHPTADPAFRSKLVASSASSARAAKAVAEQIRGIERHGMLAEGTLEEADSRERHVLGVALEGRAAIEDFQRDIARSAGTLRRLVARFPHEFNMRVRFLRSLTGPMALAALPGMELLGMTNWPFVAAGLFIVNEPFSVIPHRFGRDLFARAAAERLEGFWAGKEAWLYDSKTYALQGGLVDALLKYGKIPEAIKEPLWNQDYHGSHGLFSRILKKFILPRNARRAFPPAEAAATIEKWTNEEKSRWVTMDRLLWRPSPEADPVMVMTIRTSSARPRFPKPVTEKSRALDLLPDLGRLPAPVPVPVPVPGSRRR